MHSERAVPARPIRSHTSSAGIPVLITPMSGCITMRVLITSVAKGRSVDMMLLLPARRKRHAMTNTPYGVIEIVGNHTTASTGHSLNGLARAAETDHADWMVRSAVSRGHMETGLSNTLQVTLESRLPTEVRLAGPVSPQTAPGRGMASPRVTLSNPCLRVLGRRHAASTPPVTANPA